MELSFSGGIAASDCGSLLPLFPMQPAARECGMV